MANLSQMVVMLGDRWMLGKIIIIFLPSGSPAVPVREDNGQFPCFLTTAT